MRPAPDGTDAVTIACGKGITDRGDTWVHHLELIHCDPVSICETLTGICCLRLNPTVKRATWSTDSLTSSHDGGDCWRCGDCGLVGGEA